MDYYKILNVPKNASQDDIKRAYRKMASKHHPDKGGTKEEFQKIEEAYRTLSDSHTRQQYDNPAFNMPEGFSFNFGGTNPFEDIINQFARQQQQARARTRIYTADVFVTLEQIAFGSSHVITLHTDSGSKIFNIQIPKNVEDGQRLKYDGLLDDGPVMITFRVHAHKMYTRRGLDLHSDANISVFDLILGTTLMFKTISGQELDISIKPNTKPGSQLRISNHGLEGPTGRGDQYILINAVIPDIISDELIKMLEKERLQSNSQ